MAVTYVVAFGPPAATVARASPHSRDGGPSADKVVTVTTAPSPITVKVKRLPSGDGLPLPTRMTAGAAGFDLFAAVTEDVVLKRGEIRLIPCGFAMALPPGYEAQVRPRSGLASRHGITLVNTPGTVDADYRGEVHAPLINLGPVGFVIGRGMRIAQMVVMPVPEVAIVEVNELSATGRGPGGFGHTGA